MTETTTLREDDNGKTIELKPGQQIGIDLHENASTGYRWMLETSDVRVIVIQAGNFSGKADLVGAGGRTRWIVKAVAAGTAELRGKRWRQWEGEASVKERYVVTVQVRR
jgi:inhibitor of cysteine peptidase